MTFFDYALLCVSALAAGSINGAIGSGSLVTLPVLLAVGIEPTAAIATNTIAMVLSALGGTLANREQLLRERREIAPLTLIAVVGGAIGAVLLLVTSPDAIQFVVLILLAVALLMVVGQPFIARWLTRRAGETPQFPYRSAATRIGAFFTSIYGGYFAAAQGVLLLGILGITTRRPIRDINGVKNLMTFTVNVTAALAFTVTALFGGIDVKWLAVAVMAGAALFGGYQGAAIAKRLPDLLLRALVVVVAIASLTHAALS
ncbi:sulfite exporter TauE/SafE family protein [Paramicrobacterium chengjingii]|uniref:sulfite exporter TauE/SafE family protein n=1 Tax=Paramicrobacterium chengjingii TaxID=2769067 RepID=UPI0014245E25|nr:sulfite exporter TauE/SafE family protein [Microbacterium chengjingii]